MFSHKRRRWKIEHKRELRDDEGNLCEGLIDYTARTITIDEGLCRDKRESVLRHEIMHLVFPFLAEEAVLDAEKVFAQAMQSYREM